MPECSKCEQPIQTGLLCQVCAVEHNHAGVDHSPDDTDPRCAVCHDPAPEGAYAGDRAGVWMCGPCQLLGLTPSQHDQLVTETPDALNGAVRWAVGDDSAYPDKDPAQIEAGFETASQRLVADGGPDLHEWTLDLVHEQVADEAAEPQDKSLWTSKQRLKAEASKVDFVERDEVPDLVNCLEARGEIVYWHGLIAPATEGYISEIIASEAEAEYPREILIGRLNSAKQSAEQDLVADGGQVECCPHEDCRSARFRANSLSHVGVQADEKYRCKDCNRPFDEPAERERRQHGETRQGLARNLADPDVSEPADLDGGEA